MGTPRTGRQPHPPVVGDQRHDAPETAPVNLFAANETDEIPPHRAADQCFHHGHELRSEHRAVFQHERHRQIFLLDDFANLAV